MFGTPVASEDCPRLENIGARPSVPETASKQTNADSSPQWWSGVEQVLELNGKFWVALSQERGATFPPCMSLFGFGSLEQQVEMGWIVSSPSGTDPPLPFTVVGFSALA